MRMLLSCSLVGGDGCLLEGLHLRVVHVIASAQLHLHLDPLYQTRHRSREECWCRDIRVIKELLELPILVVKAIKGTIVVVEVDVISSGVHNQRVVVYLVLRSL